MEPACCRLSLWDASGTMSIMKCGLSPTGALGLLIETCCAAMLTPWGDKVTDDNCWRDYPRPQMVRADWTKRYDPTRRVSFLGEFGGSACRVGGHLETDKTWGYGNTGGESDRAAIQARDVTLMDRIAQLAEKGHPFSRLHPDDGCRGRGQRPSHLQPQGPQVRPRSAAGRPSKDHRLL